MEAKVLEKKDGVVKLEIKIPNEEISSKEEEALNLFKASRIIPGFRKGKAPKNIVLNRFKKDINQYVVSSVLPDKVKEHLNNEKYDIITEPWSTKIEYDFGKDIFAEIQFEVVPDFELINYKNIEVEIPKFQVKDEDVDEVIEKLRDKYAQFKSADERQIAEGDFAIVDYSIICEGKEVEKRTGAWLKITSEAYLKDLVEKIKGLKKGDEKEISFKLPENYYQKEYAGKEATAKIKILQKRS